MRAASLRARGPAQGVRLRLRREVPLSAFGPALKEAALEARRL